MDSITSFWEGYSHSLIMSPSPGMDQEIHPSRQGRIDSVKINPSADDERMGNPSPPPSRFPSTLKISLRLRPREISRVSGNLLGVGDGFPNTSLVLVEHGHSLIITREGLIDSFMLCSTALMSPSCGSFLTKAGMLAIL